jgi:hypothetical protein
VSLFLLSGLYNRALAQPEDSECLFEFNKAYSINESGLQQLEQAQKYVEQNRYQDAAERYQLAIDLLQQSIDHYNKLPVLALDCSATNLSIAQNNIQLALENLNWAKSSIAGLDCVKAVNELESLSNLASEYYYDHKDPASAKRTIGDALVKSEQIKNDGICQGDYRELLVEQHHYAKSIADSLEKRSRFDSCAEHIKAADAADQQARKAVLTKNISRARLLWQQAQKHAREGLTANVCDGLYLKRLQNLKLNADQQLGKYRN